LASAAAEAFSHDRLREIALMAAVEVQHYLSRARDFFEGMKFLRDDLDAFKFSSALLGRHCAISYCDALRTGMGSTKVSSDDHSSATNNLKSLLASRRFEGRQGLHHLERLLSKKSSVAYASEAAREVQVEDIVKRAERFAKWAEETGTTLKIEGW
jgi:hypothetical protein